VSSKRKGKGEKPAPEASVGPQGPESVPGATGGELAASGPIRLPNGQLVGQPGSNGGVHRGPDLGIRRNVMEGLLMRAMIREGVLIVVDAKGKRRHRAKAPMAMAENFVTRLQLIVLKGSDANLIRLTAVANDIFKPPKNGVNGHGGPFPATFHRPPPSERPAEGEAPAPPTAPGTLIGPDGQEYVSG